MEEFLASEKMPLKQEVVVATPTAALTPSGEEPGKATDMGNGDILVRHSQGEIRWAPGLGWMMWDSKVWRTDNGDVVIWQLAKDTILDLWIRGADLVDVADIPRLRKWYHSSQNVGRLRGMIEIARTDRAVAIKVDQLDAHPNELNTQTGILDLNTFELAPHDPERLHTLIAGAGYNPDAEAPFWEATVAMALPDPKIRDYVQKGLGQSIRGTYSEFLFVPYGAGSNLKSTILNGAALALGDYAAVPLADLLVGKKEGSARSDSALAVLRGVRLVSMTETADGAKLAEPLIKQLTGEHTLTAKYMRENPFQFQNQATVWYGTNHRPVVQGSDAAIWNRLRLIPFDFAGLPPGSEARLEPSVVQAKLRDEQDGILAWLVRGLQMWQTDGLKVPAAVEAATAKYQEDMDPMAEFLADEIVFAADAYARVSEVRFAYDIHCKQTGRLQPLSAQRFNAELERHGVERRKGRDGLGDAKMWFGLRLKTDFTAATF